MSEAEWAALDSLKPWADNPRTHGVVPTKVARSIKRYGWGSPILVRRADRTVIAGHGRLLGIEELRRQWGKASERARKRWHPDAVRAAELGQVLVRFLDLSAEQAQQLAVADNRIPEDSSWDKTLLPDLLAEWRDDELDLSGIGFDADEIDRLTGETAAVNARKRKLPEQSFAVIVECADEDQQLEVLERCQAEGWQCRALI